MWIVLGIFGFCLCLGVVGIIVAACGGGEDGLMGISIFCTCLGSGVLFLLFKGQIKAFIQKYKKLLILLAILILALVIVLSILSSTQMTIKKELKADGLHSSKVTISRLFRHEEYTFYKINIVADGFSSLTEQEMFDVYNTIEWVLRNDDKLFLQENLYITSDGHQYTFDDNTYDSVSPGYYIYCDGEVCAYRYNNSMEKYASVEGNYRCNFCGGDGRTHDWNDSGRSCYKCGGDGWM